MSALGQLEARYSRILRVFRVMAMGCERGTDEGAIWAQRYVPKGVLRKFRTEGEPERVGKSKDFITVALGEA